MTGLEQQHFDVVVVGAGPAGAMSAIKVAEGGLSVAIIDQAALPRRKVCAGGLVKRAVSLIPHEIHYPIEHNAMRLLCIRSLMTSVF